MYISKYQLLCLIILFEIGGTTIFALGIKSKQDAWISIILAMLIGFFLLWIYVKLQNYFPEKNIAEIIIVLMGKYIGTPLVILYSLYFIYIGIRNFRVFSELITITFLPETPLIAILSIFTITSIYIILLGLEVLGRTSEITMPSILTFIISIYVMIIISGRVELKQLTPILEDGLGPVFKAAFPAIVTFPFGEMVLFLMYWCHVNSKQSIQKTSFLAVSISGILIIISSIFLIAVLGADYASSATIPLLEVIKLINIGDILTNLDALGIVLIIIPGLYKMILFFYGGVLSLTTLFNIKDKRWVIILIGVFILWVSFVFEDSYSYHVWLGIDMTTKYIHIPFQIIIPALMLIICFFKKKINENQH